MSDTISLKQNFKRDVSLQKNRQVKNAYNMHNLRDTIPIIPLKLILISKYNISLSCSPKNGIYLPNFCGDYIYKLLNI